MKKKVAIIGGGMTGLAAATTLSDLGFEVHILEASEKCGGLASGFKPRTGSNQSAWKWSLESFYHHIFTGDRDVQNLAQKVGAKVFFKKPLTSSFFRLKEVQLDSPISLLKFSSLTLPSRLQMGLGLALLKIIPNGLFLERYKATEVLPKLLGTEGYRLIWKKLLTAKFGPFVNEVNMAWFWSRVAKRSQKLGYFEGGFQNLVEKTVGYIKNKGGKVISGKKVSTITGWIPGQARNDEDVVNEGVRVDGEKFDAVVITTPATTIEKLIPEISFPKLNYLWGQTLILETTRKVMKSYWLNILEEKWPFLVMVEHTNFADRKNYGGKHLIYLGNYLPEGHPQLKMTKEQLFKLYSPFIKKVNRKFNKKNVTEMFLFRSPFAQPVFPVNYASQIPEMRTATKGVYIANMSMVYPFDRGTNYAVKMGNEVAKMIASDLK